MRAHSNCKKRWNNFLERPNLDRPPTRRRGADSQGNLEHDLPPGSSCPQTSLGFACFDIFWRSTLTHFGHLYKGDGTPTLASCTTSGANHHPSHLAFPLHRALPAQAHQCRGLSGTHVSQREHRLDNPPRPSPWEQREPPKRVGHTLRVGSQSPALLAGAAVAGRSNKQWHVERGADRWRKRGERGHAREWREDARALRRRPPS